MNAALRSSPVIRWHHRILGVVWALWGLIAIGNILQGIPWDDYATWIALFVAASYVITGIGFIFGRTWARRIMGVLMALAVLLFLDLMLMSGFNGNRTGIWEMLAALGLAGYTLLFLALSSFYRH